MFTGIIEAIGRLRACQTGKKETLLRIDTPYSGLKKGASLAVNGVCLTVVGRSKKRYSFHVLNETKKRSNLNKLRPGSFVNLERSLKASGRLEGHFVLGHVDGVGKVIKAVHKDREKSFLVAYPKNLRPYIFEKGSVGIDGVSLTLGKITPKGFWVHCIPHTLKATVLQYYKPGTPVNLEADILLKLAIKILRRPMSKSRARSLD